MEQCIAGLQGEKTMVVITHNLAAAQAAGQIIVLSEGKVQAMGRHQELTENCPAYRKLLQAGAGM